VFFNLQHLVVSFNQKIILCTKKLWWGCNVETKLEFKNTSTLNMYSSSYDLNAQKDRIQDAQIINQENKILDNGIKFENTHYLNSKFVFKNGYQFNEIGANNLDEINTPSFYRKILMYYEYMRWYLKGGLLIQFRECF